MAIIETKFSVGDVFFRGDTSYETQYVKCPDCLGLKTVKITFADNRIEDLSCYTCRTWGWGEHSAGHLDFKVWVPRVRKGTVTGVEFSDGKVRYRASCGWETCDDGQIYEPKYIMEEADMYLVEQEAFRAAEKEVERSTAIELENLFKKKGSFAKRLEDSSLRYTRQQALEEERKMKRWIKAIKSR